MSHSVTIGEAARQSRVKVPTIRYYEQIGLLPAPSRSEANRRHYEADDSQRLAFIRHARELGFEIEAIRALLTLQDDPGQPCATADAIAQMRIADVEQRISEGCRHGKVGDCRVIEVLADHSQCRHDH